jgi:adenosylcobinamide amidohydrolase
LVLELKLKKNKRKFNLDLDGTKAEIIYHRFKGINVKTFLVSFVCPRRILSTLEGFKQVSFIGNHYNPPELWDFVHKNRKSYEQKIYAELGIIPDEIAMLFTGADMDNISIKKDECNDIKVFACVTAGVKHNAQRIGVDKARSIEIEEGKFKEIGTVNVIVLTNASLIDGAMARSIITITEAKTIAFQDLNIKSSYNPKIQATGTGTDNTIVVSGFGPRITYVGGHAKIGEIMARTVTSAVKEAIFKQDKLNISL